MHGFWEFFVARGKQNRCLERHRGAIEGKKARNKTKNICNCNFLILILIPIYPYIKLFLDNMRYYYLSLEIKKACNTINYNYTKLLRLAIIQRIVSFYILRSLGVYKHFFLQISPIQLRSILLYFFIVPWTFSLIL